MNQPKDFLSKETRKNIAFIIKKYRRLAKEFGIKAESPKVPSEKIVSMYIPDLEGMVKILKAGMKKKDILQEELSRLREKNTSPYLKGILRTAAACALSAVLYTNSTAPNYAFTAKEYYISLSEHWKKEYSEQLERKNSSLTKGLRKIYEREALYAPLARKYAPKLKKTEQETLDFLVAHEWKESEGNLSCVSYANAKGPRQFMKNTAKYYFKEKNPFIDAVYDPQKAAEAALKYLAEYRAIFKDYETPFELALLSYNAGYYKIKSILEKNPEIKSVYEIYPALLKEEQTNYIPQINAVISHLGNFDSSSQEYAFQMHRTRYGETLSSIAKKYESSIELIRRYNGIKDENNIPSKYELKIPVKVSKSAKKFY